MPFSNNCPDNIPDPLPVPSGNPIPCPLPGCQQWQICLASMLQVFIGDFDGTQFTIDRLCQLLTVAAYQVAADLRCYCGDCELVFTVDITTGSLSLDPLLPENAVIANLIVYKAACIIDQGTARSRAISEGVSARCGPASLSVSSGSRSFDAVFTHGPCAGYKTLLDQCCFRGPIADAEYARAVVSAFTSENNFCCEPKPSCHGEETVGRDGRACCN